MNVFECRDYREAIRKRTREMGENKQGFNLKYVSRLIPLQYTYFSRTLNNPKAHLSEDHLYRVCKILAFRPDETEFVFLLRTQAVSSDSERIAAITAKIEEIRRSRVLQAELQEYDPSAISKQVSYLVDPVAVLVHRGLSISAMKENPWKMCSALGITSDRLEEVLRKLAEAGFIERDDSGNVRELKQQSIHFGPEHPFMRIHQSLFRHATSARLLQTSEKDKMSFMATFTADEATREKIARRFQEFVKEIQSLAIRSRDQHLYQLAFDLFRWF